MDNRGFPRPAKDLAPGGGCGQPCVRAVAPGRTTLAEPRCLWIRGRLFHSRPQSCSLTGEALSGCQAGTPVKPMHCQKKRQSKDSLYGSTTCVAFTRQSDSCPQSCPTNVGKDDGFGRMRMASRHSSATGPLAARDWIVRSQPTDFFCERCLSRFSFLHIQCLNSRNR